MKGSPMSGMKTQPLNNGSGLIHQNRGPVGPEGPPGTDEIRLTFFTPIPGGELEQTVQETVRAIR